MKMNQKIPVLLVLLSAVPFAALADTNTIPAPAVPGASAKEELLQGGSSDKIILPDVDLTIEDESEVPLRSQNDRLLRDSVPDYGEIDMDELSRTKVSDKFQSEMRDERRREDFSLSAFKFYYGRYENFIADINVGKRVGGLNYLLSYLRNNRASLGYGTNTYYNTELEIDDLNADVIWTLTSNLDLSVQFGYYARDIGLSTNSANLSESKMNIPARIGALYLMGGNSALKANVFYNSLNLTHKLAAGYRSQYLWDAGGDVSFEANWSRDNFLKASAAYQYASLDGSTVHYGKLSLVDKFPIISSLAVQAGAEVDFYSQKSVFWYPVLMAYYRLTDVLSLKAGVTGSQENLFADRFLRENQIDYQPVSPEEKWTFLFSATLMPIRTFKLRGLVSYQAYGYYPNYVHQSSNDLYTLASLSNLGVLEAEAGAEWIVFENLSLVANYQFRLPFASDLLFFYGHRAYLEADLRLPDWGTELVTRFAYRDRVLFLPGAWLPPALVWDFSVMQSLSREFTIELKLNNILNQETFEKPCVPGGGFVFSAGLRILL